MHDCHQLIRAPLATLVTAIVLSLLGTPPPAAASPAGSIGRATAGYAYLSPVPGSRMVSPLNNVALRYGAPIQRGSVDGARLAVTGERSGPHDGALTLAGDGLTLVFAPRVPFALGERVTVRLDAAPRTADGESLPPLAFDFKVGNIDPRMRPHDVLASVDPEWVIRAGASAVPEAADASPRVALDGTLPSNYPNLTITPHDPEPGMLFMAPFSGASRGRMMILDAQGQPIFYRSVPGLVFDFKRQPNGMLTYFTDDRFWVLDSAYAVVKTIEMGNGYLTDEHELQLLPDGHALLMAYDPQPVPMDTIVPGGQPDATVIGLIVQEVDGDGNVVFQWRSWDHFEITDADTCIVRLRNRQVDYAHGNAIEVDLDGNLLISSRNMNEITKIDRNTGEILWRLGQAAKNNQFTFVDDPRPWTGQHDIRVLPNGHYTLFDNGNCQDSLYSRALEISVDVDSMQVSRVWQERQEPDTYTPFMGNHQRLPSGGTLVGWGGTATDPKVTEFHADGSPSLEVRFNAANTYSYRSFRLPWEWAHLEATPATVDFDSVDAGNTAEIPIEIRNVSASDFTVTCVVSTFAYFSVDVPEPIVIPAGGVDTVMARFAPLANGDVSATLYARSVVDTELVAQAIVTVTGHGVGPTAVDGPAVTARSALHAARPSPSAGATTIEFDLAQPGWVTLEVFDLQGRKVDTLIDGVRPAGRHGATWSGRGRLAGAYFYRLRSGAFAATRRLVLVR